MSLSLRKASMALGIAALAAVALWVHSRFQHDLAEAAGAQERARVHAMAEQILPVSARAQGLRDDSVLGRRLGPYALETIRAPTLVISARDDGYGTYASSQYTASRITGARFIGFDDGGHVLVGHDERVRTKILAWLE